LPAAALFGSSFVAWRVVLPGECRLKAGSSRDWLPHSGALPCVHIRSDSSHFASESPRRSILCRPPRAGCATQKLSSAEIGRKPARSGRTYYYRPFCLRFRHCTGRRPRCAAPKHADFAQKSRRLNWSCGTFQLLCPEPLDGHEDSPGDEGYAHLDSQEPVSGRCWLLRKSSTAAAGTLPPLE